MFVQAASSHHWKEGARTPDSLRQTNLSVTAGSIPYNMIALGKLLTLFDFQFLHLIKGGLAAVVMLIIIIITYCVFTISQLLC